MSWVAMLCTTRKAENGRLPGGAPALGRSAKNRVCPELLGERRSEQTAEDEDKGQAILRAQGLQALTVEKTSAAQGVGVGKSLSITQIEIAPGQLAPPASPTFNKTTLKLSSFRYALCQVLSEKARSQWMTAPDLPDPA